MALAQMVGPYGDILTMKIVRDKISRKSKGYAFVEMADRAAADNVVEALNGALLKDKVLAVNISVDIPVAAKPAYRKVERLIPASKSKRPRIKR